MNCRININSDAGLFAGNGIAADLRYSPSNKNNILYHYKMAKLVILLVFLHLEQTDTTLIKLVQVDLTQLTIPSIIYGQPTQAATQGNEVNERGKGRVFFASTDPRWILRVGKF